MEEVAQTSLVEVVEGTGDLSRVEPGVLLRQATMSLHVEHEVTTIDTLDHKEQPAERECVCVWVCVGVVWQRYHLLSVWKQECRPTRNG